jgi:hypothetical protein
MICDVAIKAVTQAMARVEKKNDPKNDDSGQRFLWICDYFDLNKALIK